MNRHSTKQNRGEHMKKIEYSANKMHILKPFDADYVAQVLVEIWGREQGYENIKFKFVPKEKPTQAEQNSALEQL